MQKLESTMTMMEIEEESNPNVNNGLPPVKYFSNVTRSSECDSQFMLVQLNLDPNETTQRYTVDLLVNHTSLFYNRALIKNAETFIHQATLNKVHNASAEADFDDQFAALKNKTHSKVKEILKKSVFEVACTLKGVDVLVPDVAPDDISFDQSKFIMLQTGNLILRSSESVTQKIDPYFYQTLGGDSVAIVNKLQTVKDREEYIFTIFDLQLLYINSTNHLEVILFNEVNKDEIERQFSILRRSDI